MFLKIENIGVAPVEGYLFLGVSTSRSSSNKSVIGKFGSGGNFSISTLLRKGINPVIFCGHCRLDFFSEPLLVNDGLVEQEFNQVKCRQSGKYDGKQVNKTIDTGFTLEFGELDWTRTAYAIREFISNAIDRSLKELGDISGVSIEIVADNQVRAKEGKTRVFIPLTPEVQKFYNQLNKRFLHFKRLPSGVLMDKKDRNLEEGNFGPVIYKNGVYVGEMQGKSLFDYNLGEQIKLDESRNLNVNEIGSVIGSALEQATQSQYETIIRAAQSGEEYVETKLAYYQLRVDRPNLKKAFENLFGERAVLCDMPILYSRIVEKGYTPICLAGEGWRDELKQAGVKTYGDVLDAFTVEGNEVREAPQDLQSLAKWIWYQLEEKDLTANKECPEIHCFTKFMDAGASLKGEYRDGKVFINQDIIGGNSVELKMTILEEFSHHITGSTDMSRDFQDFVLRVAISFMS